MKTARMALIALAITVIVGSVLQLGSGTAYAAGGQGATCPGGSNCGCSTKFAPVLCGKQKCRYTNFCFAQCSGWTVKDCSDVP